MMILPLIYIKIINLCLLFHKKTLIYIKETKTTVNLYKNISCSLKFSPFFIG